jgi:hypothetical protein
MLKQTVVNKPALITVYLIAFLQGLTLVSFPASSAVLRQMHGFTDAQYGAIFLPQVALAVLGAVAGGTLARRSGSATVAVVDGGGQRPVATGIGGERLGHAGAGVSGHSGGNGAAGMEFRAGRRTAEQLSAPIFSPPRAGGGGRPAHPAGTRFDGGTAVGGRFRSGRICGSVSPCCCWV